MSPPKNFMHGLISWCLSRAFGLYRILTRIQRTQFLDSLSGHEKLDPVRINTIRAGDLLNHIEWIRRRVQRWPYWYRGHQELARLALSLGDREQAYASLQACFALQPDARERVPEGLLLGQCYLASRMIDQAITALSTVHEKHPENFRVIEELSASYAARGDVRNVKELLQKIPEGRRSVEAEAALQWSQSQRNPD